MSPYDDLTARAEAWLQSGRGLEPPSNLIADLLAAVRALEAENEQLLESRDRYRESVVRLGNESDLLRDQVASLTTERDNAVRLLTEVGAFLRANHLWDYGVNDYLANDYLARLAAQKETT